MPTSQQRIILTTRSWFVVSTAVCTLLTIGAVANQILPKYGGFESEHFGGWQSLDNRVPSPPRTVTDTPREGSYCLEIFAPDTGINTYFCPGLHINPYVTWQTDESLVIRFSLRSLDASPGTLVTCKVRAKDPQGKEFFFYLIPYHAGQAEWKHIKNGDEEWDVQETLAAFDSTAKPGPTAYVQWLNGDWQTGPYSVKTGLWVDYSVDLKAAFEAPNAPARPSELQIHQIGIANRIVRGTCIQVDGFNIESGVSAQVSSHKTKNELDAHLVAAAKFTGVPVIDGKLDDPVYSDAPQLLLKSKNGGAPPGTVRLGYDDDNLYIAFECTEPQLGKRVLKIKEQGGRVWEDDSVEVFLDTNCDRVSYYHLIVNGLGIVDATFRPPGEGDIHWDANIAVKTTAADDHWAVEIAIPFSELGVSTSTPNMWGATFARNRHIIGEKVEYSVWSGWHHKPKSFGTLTRINVDFKKIAVRGVKEPGLVGDIKPYNWDRLSALAPELSWIREEGLRIYAGWPAGLGDSDAKSKLRLQKFLDKFKETGFNAAKVGWAQDPTPLSQYHNYASLLEARKRGLRVFAHFGYVYSNGVLGISDLRHYVDKTGENWNAENSTMRTCPRDERLWDRRLRQIANNLLDWTESIEIPDLLTGIVIDVEPMFLNEACHCDSCFNDFLELKNVVVKPVEAGDRHRFLLENNLVYDFRTWAADELVRIVGSVRDDIRARRPVMLFGFYPYHPNEFYGQALLKALGTASAPAVGWNDETYYSGYSGAPFRPGWLYSQARQELGYESLALFSILYTIHDSSTTSGYSPLRAGEEVYNFGLATPGIYCYGTNKPNMNLWDAHLPYWPEFAKANQQLLARGHIKRLQAPPPSSKLVKHINAILAELDKEAAARGIEVVQ